MKIIFIAKKLESASYLFYKDSFSKMKKIDSQISIDFHSINDDFDYQKYDFVFFMGGAIDLKKAKDINSSIKCVVIDSRYGHKDRFENIDLVVSNGFENYLHNYSSAYKNFTYPTYPEVNFLDKYPKKNNNLILGYHGNKIHFEAMLPRITDSIKELNKKYTTELWAMYNLNSLGKSKKITSNKLGFKVKHIQYSYDNYAKYLSQTDIGLIPQLIPYKDNLISRLISTKSFSKFKMSYGDYLMRFKDTTNLGRHFIFCQLRIPIISDITPSSMSFIKNEKNGFLAYTSKNWLDYLLNLAANVNLRKNIANEAYNDWSKNYSHDKLNIEFINLLKSL
jgi:hypothetical protein